MRYVAVVCLALALAKTQLASAQGLTMQMSTAGASPSRAT